MQTLLLACYICLQLTTSPDVKSACDQCVTGLFEQAGKSSNLQEALASNGALKQALEEKLKAALPQEPVTTQDEAGQGSFLEKPAESNQISQEQAQRDALIKAREEAVEKEIQEKSDEIATKVKRYEVQLNDELAAIIRTKAEDISYKVKKFKDNLDVDFTLFAQIKRDTLALDVAEMKQQVAVTGHGDTLENCHALVARDSLVSENGQYKATMLKSGELIITTGNDIVIKRIGNRSTESTDCILLIQPDCNLVIYNSGRANWATGYYDPTNGTKCYLKINNYGDLSVYDHQGQRVWTA